MTARIAAAACTRIEIDANSASLLLESALVRSCGAPNRSIKESLKLVKATRLGHSSVCGSEASLEAECWQADAFGKLASCEILEAEVVRHRPFFALPAANRPRSLARRCTEGAQTRSLQARENARPV